MPLIGSFLSSRFCLRHEIAHPSGAFIRGELVGRENLLIGLSGVVIYVRVTMPEREATKQATASGLERAKRKA
jgi:hypothetical protein